MGDHSKLTHCLHGLRCSTFTSRVIAMGDVNHDGLENDGYTKENPRPFVALPSTKALGKWVTLTLPGFGSCTLMVMDVGPYLWWDDDFVLYGKRPFIEGAYANQIKFPSEDDGRKKWSKCEFSGKVPTSRASIDITPPVWKMLGVREEHLNSRKFPVKRYEDMSVDNMSIEFFVEEPIPFDDNEIPEWLRL